MGQPQSSDVGLPPNSAGYLLPPSAERSTAASHRAPPHAAARRRLDMRWSRLTMDQLRDEEFLTKQLRRMETLRSASARRRAAAAVSSGQGRASASASASAARDSAGTHSVFASATMGRLSLQERLGHGPTAASSPDDMGDDNAAAVVRAVRNRDALVGAGSSSDRDSMRRELDLLNALYLLGDLEQPKLAALMLQKLRELLLRLCSFPDPFYDLLALQRYILRSVYDAVHVQHQHQRALVHVSAAALAAIQDAISPAPRLALLSSSQRTDSARTTASARRPSVSAAAVTTAATGDPSAVAPPSAVVALSMKPKDKVAREASMGIRVVSSLLSSLMGQQPTTTAMLTQRREVLADVVLLIRTLPLQSLAPTTVTQTPLPPTITRSAALLASQSAAAESQELVDKIQRFLLAACPPPPPSGIRAGPSSPKVHAVASLPSDFDVADRTSAVNALIYLAAARSSLCDFLLAVQVILGASDYPIELRDGSQQQQQSQLSQWSSVSLVTPRLAVSPTATSVAPLVRTKSKDQHPALRPDSAALEPEDAVVVKTRSSGEHVESVELRAGLVKLTASSIQRTDPTDGPVLSTHDVVTQVKRKALPRGFVPKVVGSTSTGGSVGSTASSARTTSLHQHWSAGSHPITALSSGGGYKARTKEDVRELLGSSSSVTTFSLDVSMAAMSDTSERDGFALGSSRADSYVPMAKCLKLKPLSVVAVLHELDNARASVPQKAATLRPARGSYTAASSASASSSDLLSLEQDDCDDKEVWSCGQNSYGELGHGDTVTRKSFDRVEALQRKDVIQISAGNEHTLVLCSDGAVLTCGYNDNGQCGVGATTRVSSVSAVEPLEDHSIVAQVHAYNGCEHSVVVTHDGRAATFGYNYRGQLGHGTTASENVPKLIQSLETRVVRLVSCSYYHTIIMCDDVGSRSSSSNVYTFGRNDYGQLGHNDTIDRKVPQRVDALAGQHVVSVACGQYHTMLVSATGRAFGFGKNDYGQLGIETVEHQLVPVAVRSGFETHTCLEVRCGYYHTIVLCSGAHVFGFGRNDYGQLGLASPTASAAATAQLQQQQRFATPQLITELEGKEIVRFACGCYHTITVSDSGVLYVFGRNNHGQLGTGDTVERLAPCPIEDFLGKRIAMVAAGFYHTLVLTGGKDDDKSEQDGSDDNALGDSESAATAASQNTVSSTSILAAPSVRAMLASRASGESTCDSAEQVTTKRSKAQRRRTDSAGDNSRGDPSWNPGDGSDDSDGDGGRDEDVAQQHGWRLAAASGVRARASADGATSRPDTSEGIDSIDVAVVIVAELDRLCKPFVPKRDMYPALQHPSAAAMKLLETALTATTTSRLSICDVFDGCFAPHVIDTSSATFERIYVLLRHVSTKCIKRLATSSTIHGASDNQLQVYVLLACLRLLTANIAQLLRSGLGKAMLLVTQGRERGANGPDSASAAAPTSPLVRELERLAALIQQLRDCLVTLVDVTPRHAALFSADVDAVSSRDMAATIAREAVDALMLGLELFFPCQCEQREFFLYVLDHRVERTSVHCAACSSEKLLHHSSESYPRARKLLLAPLLRRMADDALVAKLLPLTVSTSSVDATITSSAKPPLEPLATITTVFTALLERIATDFTRTIGESTSIADVDAATPDASTSPAAALSSSAHAMFVFAVVLQKHIAAWAASCERWVRGIDALWDLRAPMAHRVAALADCALRVDAHAADAVPLAWRCCLDLALAVLAQARDVLEQVVSAELVPSPSFGHHTARADDNSAMRRDAVADLVGASVVAHVLPSVVASLLVFTNNALFAATLLGPVTHVLRLLDDFNQRVPAIRVMLDKRIGRVTSAFASAGSNKPSAAVALKTTATRNTADAACATDQSSIGDVVALPWSYLLEKQLAVLAAEMAVTLAIGDPLFVCESKQSASSSDSVSTRWLSSSLLAGGLCDSVVRTSIQRTSDPATAISDATRIVQHVPQSEVASERLTLSTDARPFALVLPPHRSARSDAVDAAHYWRHGASSSSGATVYVCIEHYTAALSTESLDNFLSCMCLGRVGNCCARARGLCDWVRTHYATTNATYRMLARQRPNASSTMSALSDDTRIEYAAFAALLRHHALASVALHIVQSTNVVVSTARAPPRAFVALWQTVAEVRRRFSSKKTAIKNAAPSGSDGSSCDAETAVAALATTIVERCELLLIVSQQADDKHALATLDGGFVAPWDPAVAVSETAEMRFSPAACVQPSHVHAAYGIERLPFLEAFPRSRWRRVRMFVHVTARWRLAARSWRTTSAVAAEALDFITTDEPVSTPAAVHVLLVDPCRRVSCAARGLELMREVLAIPTFEAVQTDVVHRMSHVVVFQSHAFESSLFARTVRTRASAFYHEQFDTALCAFLTHVTQLAVFTADTLIADADAVSSQRCRLLVALLSCWAIHFKPDHFAFVNDIGVLSVLHELCASVSRVSAFAALNSSARSDLLQPQPQQLSANAASHWERLHDVASALFQHICIHFAAQATRGRVGRRSNTTALTLPPVGVPIEPVLSDVFALLFDQTAAIAQTFVSDFTSIGCVVDERGELRAITPETSRVTNSTNSVLANASSMRRSFEIIVAPRRFSSRAQGLVFPYDAMVNPSASSSRLQTPVRPAMSPLVKSNEFSLTMWLYVRDVALSSPDELSPRALAPQLVFLRGDDCAIAPYMLLVAENYGEWHLEVGLVLDVRPDTSRTQAIRRTVSERLVSKDPVALGTWTHVSIVCEATKVRLYINGVLDSQRNVTSAHATALSNARVDLPFFFGRAPSVASAAAAASQQLLAAARASNNAFSCSSTTDDRDDSAVLTSFEGLLSNFRFHNRSLSPIHVRIVFDEKRKSASALSARTTASGGNRALSRRDDDLSEQHQRLLAHLAVLLLLSASSEGRAHFAANGPAWLEQLWATLVHARALRVQQSVLRVLRAMLPHERPDVVSAMLIREAAIDDDASLRRASFGFDNADDVFVQQLLRIVGFCKVKCPNALRCTDAPSALPVQSTAPSQRVVDLPWTLMLPLGVHRDELSPLRDERDAAAWCLDDDVEQQEHAASLHALALGNDVLELLTHLYAADANAQRWRVSIDRTIARCVHNAGVRPEPVVTTTDTNTVESLLLRIGQRVVSRDAVRMLEGIASFHALSGVVDFVRPGATVELALGGDIAHVVAIQQLRHCSAASDGSTERADGTQHFAYVTVCRSADRCDVTACSALPAGTSMHEPWYAQVWHHLRLDGHTRPSESDEHDVLIARPRYMYVNVQDLEPVHVTKSPVALALRMPALMSALWINGSKSDSDDSAPTLASVCYTQLCASVDDVVHAAASGASDTAQLPLLSQHTSNVMLKVLMQATASAMNACDLLRHRALTQRLVALAVSDDGNAVVATLSEVEHKVALLRQRLYEVLIDMDDDGDVELAQYYRSCVAATADARTPTAHRTNRQESTTDRLSDRVGAEDRRNSERVVHEPLKARRDSAPNSGRRERSLDDVDAAVQAMMERDDSGVDSAAVLRRNIVALASSASADLVNDMQDEGEDDGDGDNEENENSDDDDEELEDDEDGDEELEDDDGELEGDEEDEGDDDDESRAEFVDELMLMGFPEEWCLLALKQTANDIVGASAWIVDNLEYLSRLQTTLDKQRDSGRETPRFNDEEDDNVADDSVSDVDATMCCDDVDARQPDFTSDGGVGDATSHVLTDAVGRNSSAVPLLNDKELARKVFGEMYFPFEDGGYRSNTRHCFMQSWRTERVEMKLASLAKQSLSTDDELDDPASDAASLFLETVPGLAQYRSSIDRLELRPLVETLQALEQTLLVLYARQCVTTLCTHATAMQSLFPTDYTAFFELLKLVLFRGRSVRVATMQPEHGNAQQQLHERSAEDVMASAITSLSTHDAERFTLAVLEFAVAEIEKAAAHKSYEAYLWTQRDLERADSAAQAEPAIEVVAWLVDQLVACRSGAAPWRAVAVLARLVKRLRCSLRSANLPLKFLALHMTSMILTKAAAVEGNSMASAVVAESELAMRDFVHAAKQRHAREIVQHRLVFSMYLQAFVEVLHVLERIKRATDASNATATTTVLGGDPFTALSAPIADITPTNPRGDAHRSLAFDRKRCRTNLVAISDDGASAAYSGNEVWKSVFAAERFAAGVVTWEVRVDKSSSSYLFVGIGDHRASSDSFLGADDHSWGYIGDKALYYQRNRVKAYGDSFSEGDCIGVTLDCERGTLSFAKNGVDLGVAFDNIVGEVSPAVAFYSRHQRVSFTPGSLVVASDDRSGDNGSGSEATHVAISASVSREPGSVDEALVVCEMMASMVEREPVREALLASAFEMTKQWLAGSKKYVTTRAGKPLWVDVTREQCAPLGFEAGDRVRTSRGNGVVVGVAEQRLWVEVDGDLGAWYYHPSRLRSLTLISVSASTAQRPSSSCAKQGDSTPLAVSTDQRALDVEAAGHAPSGDDTHTFTAFQARVNDSMWSLALDREVMAALNDFCETTSASPWNLTPSQVLDVLTKRATDLERVAGRSLFAPALSDTTAACLVARVGFLRFFNAYFSRVVAYFDLTWHYFRPTASLVPCQLVSKCRGSLFVAIKHENFAALMDKTANAPKKSDDDYDYPDDLPQVLLNRPKAATAKCHPGSTKSLFLSLFGQAFDALHFRPLRELRMVYSHPMDDGQLRSFKVKFEGEGVDDYGGPYREFFSQFFAELQMLRTEDEQPSDYTPHHHNTESSDSNSDSAAPTECLLPFLLPSPNWRNGVGANREKFVINAALLRTSSVASGYDSSAASSTAPSQSSSNSAVAATTTEHEHESADEKRQLHGEMFYFLGQMLGTCLRTRVCVRLDLAISVWKHLVGELDDCDGSNDTSVRDDGGGKAASDNDTVYSSSKSDRYESTLQLLKEVDFVAYTLWKTLRTVLTDYERLQALGAGHDDRRVLALQEQLEAMDLTFTTFLSDGQAVELCAGGANTPVTLVNLDAYLTAVIRARATEANDVMNIIKQGLDSILPVTALGLYTWQELEKRVCGVADVDVPLLMQNTEYDEDVSPTDEFVQRFWRVLAAMEDEDKRCFLRFVWARSRLPAGTAQFHQKFKIQSVAPSGAGAANGDANSSSSASTAWMDAQLPKSHTCFFALQLPRYSTDAICTKQMLYAIRNCVEMDGDFRLADTEMTGWNDIDPSDQLRF